MLRKSGEEEMTLQRLRLMIVLLVFSWSVLSNRTTAAAQSESATPGPDLPLQYSATAFGQAGSAAGKHFGLNVYITAWTSDQEFQDFAGTLKKSGPDGLVRAMEKTKDVGRLSPTGFVGSGFRIARYRPAPEGGLRIVMVTNRPMSFGELYRGSRSTDYQFGILVLNIDKDGKATGTLAPVCKIKFDKNGQLEIEHYGQKPWRLANVRREK
jgi:hypothetical protein